MRLRRLLAMFAAVVCPSACVASRVHPPSVRALPPAPADAHTIAAAAAAAEGICEVQQPQSELGRWTPSSWRAHPARQLPAYEDEAELREVLAQLAAAEPLVAQRDVQQLTHALAEATSGNGFLLMGGDCAETFKEFSNQRVRETYDLLQQMALAMSYGSRQPVVAVGRIAGQFAKPRSDAFEEQRGLQLLSYRGDIINGEAFDAAARRPQPSRMLRAYRQSLQTVQQLQQLALEQSLDARTAQLHRLNLDFAGRAPGDSAAKMIFQQLAEESFVPPRLASATLYTSHECLLLPFEEQFTTRDKESGEWFDRSAHMLWVGERTRQLDGAHMQFARGISNPIGVKVSEKCSAEELVQMLRMLNPRNVPGRVSIITRMGASGTHAHLPGLIRAVQAHGLHVLWVCDPMHGNTVKTESGLKTRHLDSIRAEIKAFFDVHRELGSHPGGVHLELTSGDVTECVGGAVGVEQLGSRYLTACDPRLNREQSLEIAFFVADLLRRR